MKLQWSLLDFAIGAITGIVACGFQLLGCLLVIALTKYDSVSLIVGGMAFFGIAAGIFFGDDTLFAFGLGFAAGYAAIFEFCFPHALKSHAGLALVFGATSLLYFIGYGMKRGYQFIREN